MRTLQGDTMALLHLALSAIRRRLTASPYFLSWRGRFAVYTADCRITILTLLAGAMTTDESSINATEWSGLPSSIAGSVNLTEQGREWVNADRVDCSTGRTTKGIAMLHAALCRRESSRIAKRERRMANAALRLPRISNYIFPLRSRHLSLSATIALAGRLSQIRTLTMPDSARELERLSVKI
jgi:hypothetical protein